MSFFRNEVQFYWYTRYKYIQGVTRRMLHDVINLIHFHNKHKKTSLTNPFFPYILPPEGNFDIDAGIGVGWGPIRTPQISTNHWKLFVLYFSPGRELWHWRRGWGGGNPKHPKHILKQRKCSENVFWRNIFYIILYMLYILYIIYIVYLYILYI